MRKRQNERLEMLVSVALGERALEELGGVTSREEERLAQLRRLAADLQGPLYNAPDSLRLAAKAIFAPSEPIRMRIVSTNLATEGVRGETVREDIETEHDRARTVTVHAVFEVDNETARAMYVRFPDGWRVIGQAPGSGWIALCGDEDAVCDSEGRFEIVVTSIALPEIVLTSDGRRLILPSPSTDQ